jgi:hypothetical protein
MHWTAGFRLCFMSDITGPPPVMSIVRGGVAVMKEIAAAAALATVLVAAILAGYRRGQRRES